MHRRVDLARAQPPLRASIATRRDSVHALPAEQAPIRRRQSRVSPAPRERRSEIQPAAILESGVTRRRTVVPCLASRTARAAAGEESATYAALQGYARDRASPPASASPQAG